ncbi:MAG: hypothetical protein ACFFAQ_13670 [Promethearchaeota archaeon]
MTLLEEISKLEIPTNKIYYDKKSNVLSIEILNFTFIGIYKKSTKLSKILDDIYTFLGETHLNREDLSFVDFISNTIISESTKLKSLGLLEKKEFEKKEEMKEEEKQKAGKDIRTKADIVEKEVIERVKTVAAPREAPEKKKAKQARKRESFGEEKAEYKMMEEPVESADMLLYDEDEEVEMEEEPALAPPPPPPGAGAPPAPSRASVSAPPSDAKFRDAVEEVFSEVISEPKPTIVPEPKPTVYEINMGLQYYSVMMEQRSYLFYVYFSHKELKIVDEEGKTIYTTQVRIVTTKKEPPILDLKIEGEGFEVHPLTGRVVVKKDAVNPPVMIFSVLPVKSKKKMKKRESERRFLNIYIEFENKVISHSVLSIIVQPKYFRVELGPIHFNLSKKAALIISFISILIAGGSLAYTLLSIDPSSQFTDLLSGFAPGLGSIIFFAIFLITLFKEGIYPLKEKISSFLNFDQAGILIK